MSSLFREMPGDAWESVPLEVLSQMIPAVRLVRFGTGADAGVALLARNQAHVSVNGQPIAGGLHVLRHRDEVLLGRQRFWFSAESTPVVTVYQLREGERRPTCPVCRGQVKDGEQAVRCPGCDRWFHQIDNAEGRRKTCWTYAATCRFCRHPTSLSGERAWHPGQEENNG